jgi:hypothetical protein
LIIVIYLNHTYIEQLPLFSAFEKKFQNFQDKVRFLRLWLFSDSSTGWNENSLHLQLLCPFIWTSYPYPGERSKFKLDNRASTECMLLSHHHEVEKNVSQTLISWGPSINYCSLLNINLSFLKGNHWRKWFCSVCICIL